MKDSEILEKCADDVSRPGGWQQGTTGFYNEPDAPVCMSGAVYRYRKCWETPERWSDPYLHFEVGEDLPDQLTIPDYNDWPGRTAGEVADQFRVTAKRLREEGR
jgi:hypothetical protein